MSSEIRDVPVTRLQPGMTVDMEDTAREFGGNVDDTVYEFATVESVELVDNEVDGAGVVLSTDQGNYFVPPHWTVLHIAHLDEEDYDGWEEILE